MKVTLNKPPSDTITVSEITDKHYVVFRQPSMSKHIGFVCQTSYASEIYELRAFNGFTRANCWARRGAKSLQDIIKHRMLDFEFFAFETYKEALQWVIDNSE